MEDCGIFKDITILSLEQATVLAYLTYRLALEGIKVIRIGHPIYGDPNRRVRENRLGKGGIFTYLLAINYRKKVITLSLGTPEGQGVVKKLLTELKVDVFAMNQLPKNYGKLGVDYETVTSIKPHIIWVGLLRDPVLKATRRPMIRFFRHKAA
jgi:formyl-CoA transferase